MLRALRWIPCVALALTSPSAVAQPAFITFESGHVRPLALSPDGQRLFAVNTPDNHLEVFDVGSGGALSHAVSIPVGMEPVAVAARSNDEIWVVNHLSDSVSIVDLAATPPRVERTLLVGDEPRDIVFAGPGAIAFISTAHRGQHREHDSIEDVTGHGRPAVHHRGHRPRRRLGLRPPPASGRSLGGTPVEILSFFADTPRALAVGPGGNTRLRRGLPLRQPDDGRQLRRGRSSRRLRLRRAQRRRTRRRPGPERQRRGSRRARDGPHREVRRGGSWRGSAGSQTGTGVREPGPARPRRLLDRRERRSTQKTSSSSTTWGPSSSTWCANPVTGKLYVTNTELPNHVRFEGAGPARWQHRAGPPLRIAHHRARSESGPRATRST